MLFRLVAIFCLFPACLSAQKEANTWYFGKRAGMDFNTDPPTRLTNSAMSTFEGCASISDKNGRLLFYTDGITIYNKDHAQMTNGDGLTGDISSTQSAVIVQNPDSGHLYYVFTTYGTLAYSVVDTTLSGGLGAVRTKNVKLLGPATEKLTAVRHANKKDLWVITHLDTSSSHYVFLVTGAGVTASPVVSDAGIKVNPRSLGTIKVSPDGRTMALIDHRLSSASVQLLDFNNSNGAITNARTLLSGEDYYGAEFSPSGRYLYISKILGPPLVEQYDLLAGSIAAIVSSRRVLNNDPATDMPGALQLAPDGRIYVAQMAQQFLSVINFPDSAGAACGYVSRGFILSPGISQYGLPNFNQSFFAATQVKVNHTCYKDITRLSLTNTMYMDSVVWHFGDPGSAEQTSRLPATSHVYSQPGTYKGRVLIYRNHGPYTDTIDFEIVIRPKASAAFTTNPQSTDIEHPMVSMTNQSSGADHYLWDFGDNTTSVDTHPQHTYADAGVYPITLVAGIDKGCPDTARFSLRVKDVFRFYIPLSFSPNGDGFNDEFRYSCRGCFSLNMKVFNRWGEVVFATDKLNEYWNGGMNNSGPVLPEGIYTYILSVRDHTKAAHEYKGTITLIG